MLGDFNASEIERVGETAAEGTFGLQLLQLVPESGMVQHVIKATSWRFGEAFSTLNFVLTRTTNAWEV